MEHSYQKQTMDPVCQIPTMEPVYQKQATLQKPSLESDKKHASQNHTVTHQNASQPVYQNSVNRPTESQPPSRVMVLQENKTLKALKKNQDIKKVIKEVINMKGLQSSQFKDALKRLSCVPVNVLNHYYVIGEFNKVLQEKNVMTDVRIRLSDGVFYAHRVMLACFSDYFKDILYRQPPEVKLPIKVKINDVKAISFQTYIDFIYSGKLHISGNNVGDMLVLSEQLGIDCMRSQCMEYVGDMSVNQALDFMKRGLTTEIQLVKHIILQNFTVLDQCREFFYLDVDTVCSILSNNNIQISTEIDVFRMGMQWILHKSERHEHFIRVMRCVRFGQMDQHEVFQCATMADRFRDETNFRAMIVTGNW